MANVKINELEQTTNVTNTDLLIIETDNGTRSITYEKIIESLKIANKETLDVVLSKLGIIEDKLEESSGVTAGTYRSVTVDEQGRVTAGTNPTTLAGFGITNTRPVVISTTAPTDTTALWVS